MSISPQLEEFLNQSSPFYLWMNGDRVDSLLEDERHQAHELDIMQDRFHHTSSLLDSLFADSLFTREMPEPHFFRPFSHRHRRPSFFGSNSRVVRSLLPFQHFEPFNFDSVFQPFLEMMNQVQQAMETQLHESLEHLPGQTGRAGTGSSCLGGQIGKGAPKYSPSFPQPLPECTFRTKLEDEGWSRSTVWRAFALHVGDPGSIQNGPRPIKNDHLQPFFFGSKIYKLNNICH